MFTELKKLQHQAHFILKQHKTQLYQRIPLLSI